MNYFITALLFISMSSFAHDHEGGNASVGKGKGVESFDEHDGFVLAQPAVKRLGIVTVNAGSSATCNLKLAQVVASLNRKVIYVFRKGAFKSVDATCKSVLPGDSVVAKGAEFLRVVEMDLTAGEDEGAEVEAEGDHHD